MFLDIETVSTSDAIIVQYKIHGKHCSGDGCSGTRSELESRHICVIQVLSEGTSAVCATRIGFPGVEEMKL
jgi:hypothetical protein